VVDEPALDARALLVVTARTGLMMLLLTGCFYVLPERWPVRDAVGGGRLLAGLAGLGGALLVLRHQARALRAGRSLPVRIEALLTALYLLVLGFAAVYALLAQASPASFDGLQTRTDALYFTVTVLSTVGFGDIHPVAAPARLLVTLQMLFDLVFIGTAVRALSGPTSAGPRAAGSPGR
jgi:voltage-gated potassium channel